MSRKIAFGGDAMCILAIDLCPAGCDNLDLTAHSKRGELSNPLAAHDRAIVFLGLVAAFRILATFFAYNQIEFIDLVRGHSAAVILDNYREPTILELPVPLLRQ